MITDADRRAHPEKELLMPASDATDNGSGYVDIYLLPVRTERLDDYREQASIFGRAAKEHGALSYREFVGDDPDSSLTSDAGPGTVLTAAVAEFHSRAHRDEVMERVMKDPRVAAMLDADEIAHMEQMRFGGFRTIVDA
jgi:uncharacterized protein YbaA (DUF1428 family)